MADRWSSEDMFNIYRLGVEDGSKYGSPAPSDRFVDAFKSAMIKAAAMAENRKADRDNKAEQRKQPKAAKAGK